MKKFWVLLFLFHLATSCSKKGVEADRTSDFVGIWRMNPIISPGADLVITWNISKTKNTELEIISNGVVTESDNSADPVTFIDTLKGFILLDNKTIKITGQKVDNGEIFSSVGTGYLLDKKLKATIKTSYSRGGVATMNYDFDKQ